VKRGRNVDWASVGVVGIAGLLIGLLWLAVEALIRQERDNALDDAKRNNANLVRAFEQHTVRTLDHIDDLLVLISKRAQVEGDALDLAALYRDLNIDSKVVINSIITNGEGLVVKGSHGAPNVSLADREHIAVHLKEDTGRPFVGKPVHSRVADRWLMPITRRINKPDGTILGTVGVAVDPNYFSDFYKEVNIGLNGVVVLFGADGVFRSRLAETGARLDVNISQGQVFKAATQGSPRGAIIFDSVVDGIRRVFAYGPIPGYPLFVTVGTSVDRELSEANARAKAYRLAAGMASGLFLCLALGVVFFGIRWQRERRLQEAKAALEIRVEERTAELRSRQAALAEANLRLEAIGARYLEEKEAAQNASRAKSDFLSNMSHELRTPLNAVIGFAQLLSTEESIDDGHRQSALLILNSGRYLLELVNEVLDLSRVETGKLALSVVAVDSGRLLGECIASIRAEAEAAEIEIRSVVEIGTEVLADRKRLRQIITNYLSNAVKYNRRGGRIEVAATASTEDRVRLQVRDTGLGIEAGKLGELFKPFSRLVDANSGIEGTGIGLALSRRLAEAMGVSVGVESEIGSGSLFWIELPRAVSSQRDEPALSRVAS